ncbi:MAG TPA: hypothetical protein HPP56_01450 [Nitrospirae bacterium]|nr:hypothetical protein [Nitrospirota bacterium]
MQNRVINTFYDIIEALKANPDWQEEMRRLVLTGELLNLPSRFDNFVQNEFVPLKNKVIKIEKDVEILKEDVEILKEDVEILKEDVEILKEDVEILKEDVKILKEDVKILKEDVKILKNDVSYLKGDIFEGKVRDKAPAFFGKLLTKTKVIRIEDYSEVLDDANEKGLITDKERAEALNIDVLVKGIMKNNNREVILAGEVSVTVDIEDVERVSKRVKIFSKVYDKETIGVVIGQKITERAKLLADERLVVVI